MQPWLRVCSWCVRGADLYCSCLGPSSDWSMCELHPCLFRSSVLSLAGKPSRRRILVRCSPYTLDAIAVDL